MPTTAISLTFSDAGDFAAERRAVDALQSAGFSVGHSQRHAPRGILFGLYNIQKWRNLSEADREGLHGVMSGDMRNGPVTVEIFDSAPDTARTALSAYTETTRNEVRDCGALGSLSRCSERLEASRR